MTLPEGLVAAVQGRAGRGRIVSAQLIGGGCINVAARITMDNGTALFVKWNTVPLPRMFEREAEGLNTLRATRTLRVPQVIDLCDDTTGTSPAFLLLEDVSVFGEGTPDACTQPDAELGRGLAALHRCSSDQFGFGHDNYIGSTPQPNPPASSWKEFFCKHRLLYMLGLLRDSGKLDHALARRAEKAACSAALVLDDVNEPPALVHGDLWTGNVIRNADGHPVLIDPAVHYAHREVDLAMTELFGGFGDRFRSAYNESYPTDPGYKQRRDVYNLYHILNHALLFGGGYWSQAWSILRRHAD